MEEFEKVNIVDIKDKVISQIYRKDAKNINILRVVCVFIKNSKNEILLQMRSSKSKRYPSHWDSAAGGHVESHENYLEGALREMKEELGISVELDFLGKDYFELDDGRKHYHATFIGYYDGEFNIDLNELDSIKFFPLEKIKEIISSKEKFHPECLFTLKKYILK
jgi:isopentenyl-diphosphate delta-isomerase